MTASRELIRALKHELRLAGITYAKLAAELGIAESSVKRIFSKGDMPLSRIDEVLALLKLDFADLAARIAESGPLCRQLTLEQERAVVADRKLLLVAICVLSHWSFDQIIAAYAIAEAECVACLTALDRLGVIELKPFNRYRLLLDKTFRWRPEGPVMDYFRRQVVADYFSGGFDGEGETLMLIHGQIARPAALGFVERLQRLGEDFAQQQRSDQRLPMDQKTGVTMLLGLRSWLFSAFADLQRRRA